MLRKARRRRMTDRRMTDRPRITRRTWGIASVVALALFMQMLDGAVIAIALPQMARDFGVSPVAVGFGMTVYVLAASIVIPTSAWLASRLGARLLFVLAVLGFTISSLLCGLSQELWQFIAARVLQGVSGALMAPVGQMILLRSVERTQLLAVFSFTSAPMLVAPVVGPPLGGFLATQVGWEWIFYINIPAGLAVLLLALRFLPSPTSERRPFDAVGLILNAAALTPLLWGLSELGSPGASRPISGAAVVVGVIMGWLAIRHARRAEHPLLSLEPMRHATFRLTQGLSAILVRVPIMAQIFVLPILLQVGFGMSAFLAGILFLGHTGADLLMKLFTTPVYRRVGYRPMLLWTLTIMAAAMGAAALFTQATPLPLIAGVLAISGAARSFLMTGMTSLAFAEVTPEEMPNASTLNQVMAQISVAIGVTVCSLLLEIVPDLTGAAEHGTTAQACRITLAVTGALSLPALLFFARLRKDAGAELAGRAKA
jgi:EmrB/QacA subfamily drug resistance transporter